MNRRNSTFKYISNIKKRYGFTLVELVVVLTIIAILASTGIVMAIGYINRSKLEKNNQHAKTAYQAAQVALSKKSANGTLDHWIENFPLLDVDSDTDLNLPSDSETNYSAHKIVSLTYNPQTPTGDEDEYLYNLLSPYFYDMSFFKGTIAVEFDICKTKDNGFYKYTANVVSAFYSAENNSPTGGWDKKCTNNHPGQLPERADIYRAKSFVGYYCNPDYEATLGKVSSVSVPWDPTYELQGHVIGPTTNNTQATGYLFNLRNGETLDVAWAIFDADVDPDRVGKEDYNYTYSAKDNHNEDLHIVLYDTDEINEEEETYEDPTKGTQIFIYNSDLINVSYGSEFETYEYADDKTIIRTTKYGFVSAYVIRKGSSDKIKMTFPIAKTHVTGDSRIGCPVNTDEGYFEYRLTLDAMMSRGSGAESTSDNYRQNYFGIERLFKDKTPRNITAMLRSDSTWKYTDNNGKLQIKSGLANTFAARAIDDPVYLVRTSGDSSNHLAYFYTVRENCAIYDGKDDEDTFDEYVITGKAVVNTYFGDKVYATTRDDNGDNTYIGGTSWNGSKSAVLTNSRHLYNIRWMSNDTICYRIVSDINWYVHNGNLYSSEVKVFNYSSNKYSFNSPVSNDGSLKLVSFPALNELPTNATLTSISDSKKTYKINNIQMREASFISGTDLGCGLICSNKGVISNIYIDNLSLILTNAADGTTADYISANQKIGPDSAVEFSLKDNTTNKVPVGGLVGYNRGTIGSATETDESKNTVCVTNSVVMGGNYWQVYKNTGDVGGIIGKNEGISGDKSAYGLIQAGGKFLVLGYKNGGAIIGYNNSNVNARFVVDGSIGGKSEFTMPTIKSTTGEPVSCAVISYNRAGGAIGQSAEGYKFNYGAGNYQMNTVDSATGEISFADMSLDKYTISVKLPAKSLVLHVDGNATPCAGGAIGFLNSSSGDKLSIHTDIAGYVISSGKQQAYCGGAIGRENACSIKTIYLDCVNRAGSLIGLVGDSTTNGAVSAGGAYGRIDTNTDGLTRTIVINVNNSGTIAARGNSNGYGAGGAIGGVSGGNQVDSVNCYFNIPVIIKAVNQTGSLIKQTSTAVNNCTGTGGAIGGFGNNDNDNAYLTEDTIIYVENSGTITGHYNVGGAVGHLPKNLGKIYAVNSGTITSDADFVGGVVGRGMKSQQGTIGSTLKGGSITGNDFVGGAAGRLINVQSSATVSTTVKNDVTITGTGYMVGGVCGDVLISSSNAGGTFDLSGNNTNPVLTISGGSGNTSAVGTGGVAGALRTQTADAVTIGLPTQSDLDRLVMHIDGVADVGGAIGRLTSNTSTENNPANVIKNSSGTDFNISIDIMLAPQSHIIGSSDNVGGAIGNVNATGGKFIGKISVSSKYGSSSGESRIEGRQNVAGAIGRLFKSRPYFDSDINSGIKVDFEDSPWTLESKMPSGNSNLGGAIGYIEAVTDTTIPGNYKITVYLGTSTLTATCDKVGGAVGNNLASLGLTEITVQLDVGGKISGGANVGGAIGYNDLAYYSNSLLNSKTELKKNFGSIVKITTTINGTVQGSGGNVGGAVGYNKACIIDVITTVNGAVIGAGNNVGGAIGNCDASSVNYLVQNITADIRGSGLVQGNDNVGGAVGMSVCNITNMNSTISGNSKIKGNNRVGGALGFASAEKGKTGTNVLAGNNYGRIVKITVKISADLALSGRTRMGGAVGQVGDKVDGNNYNSASLVYVEATLNSAYLFDPYETGTSDSDEDQNACIGGIVGIFVDGRLGVSGANVTGGVVLKGSGGVVETSTFVSTEYYPARTYGNTVFIGAKGCSIGGLVGQIGLDEKQQNVCLSNLSVENGPDLCVVSLNGKDRIGGWIGSGYAAHGGIGNNNADEFDKTPVTYNVENVKAVISIGGSEVGGFMGRIDCYNNNQTLDQIYTFANINVVLTDANIIGRSKVGGVFGEAYCLDYRNGNKKTGVINISLNSYTNIGDLADNVLPGYGNSYTPVCYEAGGVIGCVESKRTTRKSIFNIPINITIDSTSRVCGLCVADDPSAYGVGGVFGRSDVDCRCEDNFKVQSISIISQNGNVAAVRSASSNTGGVVGVIVDGSLKNVSANVSVQADGNNICVGGVVGKIIKTSGIDKCHFGPDDIVTRNVTIAGNQEITYFESLFGTGAAYDPSSYRVVANGSEILAGGFAGSAENDDSISNCYTTATVNAANGSAVGGFIGRTKKGTISNCYASGRTYRGQYISGSGNVIGSGSVGGFVGEITGAMTINNCYSTASVLSSGSYAGGFVGSATVAATIKNSYCTGRVSVSGAETVAGAFAGRSANISFSEPCSALNGINNNWTLAGDKTAMESISNLSFKTAEEIKGTNSHNANAFDSTLPGEFALRAVINSFHWGDWPVVVYGATNIADLKIYLNQTEFEYTKLDYGIESVLLIYHGEYLLTFGTDYTIDYSGVTGVSDDAVIVISGIGNYYGAVSMTISITEVSLPAHQEAGDLVVEISYPDGVSDEGFEYTGAPNIPDSIVKIGEDVLEENIDYYLEYNPGNINIGTVSVTVVGMGNYTGKVINVGTFEIIGTNLANAEVIFNATAEELVFNNEYKTPDVIVRINGKTLDPDNEYEVNYFNNIFAGEATYEISSKVVEYSGKYIGSFIITKASNRIETEPSINGWIWNTTPSALTSELVAEFGTPVYSVHTGSTCDDSNRLVGPCAAEELQDAMKVLDAGDYYLFAAVEDNLSYSGVSKVVPFSVSPWNITNNVTIELAYTSIAYNGESREPSVIVKYNGDETLDSNNYTVSYGSDTVSVGEKTVTITGKNNCYGTATAKYKVLNVWSVSFDPNSGKLDGETSAQVAQVTDGETVAEPNDPVRDGYDFDGWYWNPNPSTSAQYNFSSPVKNHLNIYAKWTKLWKVTVHMYNGEVFDVYVRDGEPMTEPSTARDGYDFVGWFGDSGYANAWTSFSIPITRDYDLYAKGTPHKHMLNYETNGGSEIPSVEKDYGTVIAKPEDPVWEGHEFIGWYTDEEFNDPAFTDVDLLMPDNDITLYAKWEDKQ